MKPNMCPQCGEHLHTLWRPTKKHSRTKGYYTVYVPVYACLACMMAVRLLKLDANRLLTKKPGTK